VSFRLTPKQRECFADNGTPLRRPGKFGVWVGGGQPARAPGLSATFAQRTP